MNYQDKYQQAKQAGYSDDEIIAYLTEKDPEFKNKISQAEQAGYSPKEVVNFFNKPKEKESAGIGTYTEDLAKQTAQGFGIGSIGTYGDILDLLGVQPTEISEPEQAKYGREFDILEKMKRGETPSHGELLELSGDEDILPRFSRLASSEDVKRLGKKVGLVSEPKTIAGRYGKRIGRLGGGGLALGSTSLAVPIIAGITGQTLEEVGAPPWAQAAGEIIAGLKASPKSNVPITSKSKEVQQTIQNLRKAGYAEKDITLAKNALEERKLLKKYASLTPEAENTINQGIKNSENLLKDQLQKGLPGYAEGGLPYLEKQASNVYQKMEELASTVPIKNKAPVKKAIEDAIAYLEKYPLLKEQKEFIEFMQDGLNKLDKADTAEFFTGFYRNLGKAGNWGNPKQKEHILGLVQKGIKDTFAQSGKDAAKFGKYFDATNTAWKHWIGARDLMQTIEKAQGVDGTSFKKLSSLLNDPSMHELAKKVLGPEQLDNIKSISEGAQAIESLLKQIPKTDKGIHSLKILESVRSLLTGDYRPLGALITLEGARRLATQLLIDPKKQNLMKRLIDAAKNNSPEQAAILAQELVKTNSAQATPKEERRPKSVKK